MDRMVECAQRTEPNSRFTIVEFVLAVLVLAVLAAIVIPKFTTPRIRRAESELRNDLANVRRAVRLFKQDTGTYPSTLSDLSATRPPRCGIGEDGHPTPIRASCWHGPYVESVPRDPVSNRNLAYTTHSGALGDVRSSARGKSLNNSPYATW